VVTFGKAEVRKCLRIPGPGSLNLTAAPEAMGVTASCRRISSGSLAILKIAEARPPQLLGAEREPGFLCPGRQTDPTRQNVIRKFVSHRLKPIRLFARKSGSLAIFTAIRHALIASLVAPHKASGIVETAD
jgi:hypothetical protein